MFELEEITTKDGLIHQGLVAYPKIPTKTAIVWVHGLTGDFYGNTALLKTFAQESTKRGIAFGTFNNRGHDMIAGFRRVDKTEERGYSYATIGAGYEKFEECVYDLEASLQFFTEKGYSNIIFIGHSSGANKVCYYAGQVQNPSVSGIVLVCPMSDRLDPKADTREREANVKKCISLVENGREDALVTGLSFFPMTANRYMSLVTPNSSEDQFGYGDDPPVMQQFEQIRIPLFVMFAENDEYADRSIADIQKVFDRVQKSTNYTSTIIPQAFHSLVGKEPQVATKIVSWIEKIA